MFWLIWIAIMLAIPVLAGIDVWRKLNRETQDAVANTIAITDDTISA